MGLRYHGTMNETEKYQPTGQLLAALNEWRVAVKAEEHAREQLRAAVAWDLRAYQVSNSEMAEHLPWTAETVRTIANEHEVPGGRRRKLRTVKSKLKEV